MNNQQNMIYINGLISIIIMIINSIKYIFMADIHGDYGNISITYNSITYSNTMNYINNGNKCWDINALFHNMIISERSKNKNLDIFLESTYKSDDSILNSSAMKDSYIKLAYITYANCFKNDNTTCQFDNVNMYNIDIRNLHKDNNVIINLIIIYLYVYIL